MPLGFLRTFLKDGEKFYEHEEVKNLERRIRDMAYEAENTVDLFIVDTMLKKDNMMKEEDIGMAEKISHVFDGSLNLDHVKQEIEAIKTEVMEIYDKKIYEMGAKQVGNSSDGDFAKLNARTWEEETMVGFDDEEIIIKEQLTRGSKKLEAISIVGMPGLGKTTLARTVSNDSLIVYHFYIRAWIYVSQEYRKRHLLVSLLSSVIQHTNGIDQTSDEKLAEQLYKCLKGRIYFIVMDDIWDSKAWVDLKTYFPNDNNGSRILFTSRLADVALHANPTSPPLSLRFLTHGESWDLFRLKVFRREICPPKLVEIGNQIAKKYMGLPLAIVVVAGILANEEKRQDRWKQVGEIIIAWMAGDDKLWMKTIALSYKHLPQRLKP